MRTATPFLVLAAYSLAIHSPTAIAQQVTIASISVGFLHVCALDGEGRAWCWGLNDAYQVGPAAKETCRAFGSSPCSSTPIAVRTDLRFVQLAAGEFHNCALTRDGAAYCWGANHGHALGVDSVESTCRGVPCSPTPVRVDSAPPFIRVAVGYFHSCGLTADGKIYCWGTNSSGELGNDAATTDCPVTQQGKVTLEKCRARALPVSGTHHWTEVAALNFRTCALDAGGDPSGDLYCWGEWRQTDGGPLEKYGSTPKGIRTPPALHGLALGRSVSALLTAEGLPVEWGTYFEKSGDFVFQWGSPSFPEFPADQAQALREGPLFVAITSGFSHRCGLDATGAAYCWGNGGQGQLGTGKNKSLLFRRSSEWKPGKVKGGLTFKAVSAGGQTTCGLTTDGRVYCWGNNLAGQLGVGLTEEMSTVPVQVAFPGPDAITDSR